MAFIAIEVDAQPFPIPAGKYWIVDRPTGGVRSQLLLPRKTCGIRLMVAHLITMNGSRSIATMETLMTLHGSTASSADSSGRIRSAVVDFHSAVLACRAIVTSK